MTPEESIRAMERRFAAIPIKVREAVRVVMESSANEVVAEMRRVVPVDTGGLRDSINWSWGDAPAGSMQIGTVGGKEYGGLRITIYAGGSPATARRQARSSGTRRRDWSRGSYFDSDVAVYVEFGTSRMAAQPFFFPIWRIYRRRIKTRITRAMNKAIRDAMKV